MPPTRCWRLDGWLWTRKKELDQQIVYTRLGSFGLLSSLLEPFFEIFFSCLFHWLGGKFELLFFMVFFFFLESLFSFYTRGVLFVVLLLALIEAKKLLNNKSKLSSVLFYFYSSLLATWWRNSVASHFFLSQSLNVWSAEEYDVKTQRWYCFFVSFYFIFFTFFSAVCNKSWRNWSPYTSPEFNLKTPTEDMGPGSKHSPKWVNIWQPKLSQCGDLLIFGAYF